MSSSPTPWAAPAPNKSENFEPKAVVGQTTRLGLQAAGVGAFVATIQNALGTHNRGATGVFTRYGGTIGFFAAMGATFAATEAIVANQRETEDSLNGVAGACAAGFLAGIRARSFPAAVGYCAVLGAAVGGFDYTGHALVGERDGSLSREERRKRFFKQQPEPAPAE